MMRREKNAEYQKYLGELMVDIADVLEKNGISGKETEITAIASAPDEHFKIRITINGLVLPQSKHLGWVMKNKPYEGLN